MAPTFILTRSFAISGLLVGAQLACAAPLPYNGGCSSGCMFKEVDTPSSSVSSVTAPTPTVDPTAANDAVEIIKIIEVISPTPASATPGDVELLDFGETPPSEDDSSPTLFEPIRLTDIISSTLQHASESIADLV